MKPKSPLRDCPFLVKPCALSLKEMPKENTEYMLSYTWPNFNTDCAHFVFFSSDDYCRARQELSELQRQWHDEYPLIQSFHELYGRFDFLLEIISKDSFMVEELLKIMRTRKVITQDDGDRRRHLTVKKVYTLSENSFTPIPAPDVFDNNKTFVKAESLNSFRAFIYIHPTDKKKVNARTLIPHLLDGIDRATTDRMKPWVKQAVDGIYEAQRDAILIDFSFDCTDMQNLKVVSNALDPVVDKNAYMKETFLVAHSHYDYGSIAKYTTFLQGHRTVNGREDSSLGSPALQLSEVQGKVDIGIIAVRQDEFEAVLSRLDSRSSVTGGKNLYEFSTVTSEHGEIGIVTCRCLEKGQSKAQTVAGNLIEELAPRWLFVVGIAGGFPGDEFTLGDVLLASRALDVSVSAVLEDYSLEYDARGYPVHNDVEKLLSHLPALMQNKSWRKFRESIKRDKPVETIPRILPKPHDGNKFYGPDDWQEKVHKSLLLHFPPGQKARAPKFWIGPSISANTLLKSGTLAKKWKRFAREASSVEMELPGVFESAKDRGTGNCRVLAIRGVSDIVGYIRDPAWTDFACHSAASFALTLIESGFTRVAEQHR